MDDSRLVFSIYTQQHLQRDFYFVLLWLSAFTHTHTHLKRILYPPRLNLASICQRGFVSVALYPSLNVPCALTVPV